MSSEVLRPYDRVVPQLAQAVRASKATRIIDLCSGSGGPVVDVQRQLRKEGCHVPMTLTDLFPDQAAWDYVRREAGEGIDYVLEPVDATAVPEHLTGFRTLFTAFHHFRPAEAAKILIGAMERREGIGIFEQTERAPVPMFVTLAYIPLTLLAMPFVRPFSWSRLAWTYLPPVAPLYAWWEGFASCWRSYTLNELKSLLDSLPANDYVWKLGRVRGVPAGVTYLVGYPPDDQR